MREASPPGYLLIPLSSFPAIIAGKSTFPSGKALRADDIRPYGIFVGIAAKLCRGDPCGRPFFKNFRKKY